MMDQDKPVKTVTFRFKGFPRADEMRPDMERIAAWRWSGEDEVPARIEYSTGRTSVAHFPMPPVHYSKVDADALLTTLERVDGIVCAVPPAPTRPKPTRGEPRVTDTSRPAPVPALPEQVRPALRFLLSDEAQAEAGEFRKRLDWLRGSRRHALKYNAEHLDENFPHVARADAVLGGALRQVMNEAAALPPCLEVDEPVVSWMGIADALASGHPERLEPHWRDGKRREGAIADALAGIAARWKAHQDAAAAEEAKRRSCAPTKRPTHITWWAGPPEERRAAAHAARKERERLGIGLTDDLTPEQMSRIAMARVDAIAALRSKADDCPF